MTYTQKNLDDLTLAISTGARSIEYEDKKMEFPSLKSMYELKRRIEDELGITRHEVKRRVHGHTRGLQ